MLSMIKINSIKSDQMHDKTWEMIPDGSLNTDIAGVPWTYMKYWEEFQRLIVMQSAYHSQNNITTTASLVNENHFPPLICE